MSRQDPDDTASADGIEVDVDVEGALTDLAREHSGRVLAILARRFDDLDLADDAVQDGLARAAERWPTDGVPDNPPAWLMTVARNRAVDLLRRQATAERRLRQAARDLAENTKGHDSMVPSEDQPTPGQDMPDERLRLMLLCSHPAIGADARAALTLRLVAGLTTEEIAAAYLTPVATVAQRISRAKRKIREARVPMTMPTDLTERLGFVLRVLYLSFNEGYLTRGGHDRSSRVDLCEQAMRLTETAVDLTDDHPEALGLLALQRFVHARRDARFDRAGALVTLDRQDRDLWHRDEIGAANDLLRRAMAQMTPGPYQLQAVIASHHANPGPGTEIDWVRIVALYDQLLAVDPSPLVLLNRASAVAMADGPGAGLAALDEIDADELGDYHLWHATRGELLARAGRPDPAVQALATALELTTNPAERRHLEQRIEQITNG